MTSKKEMPSRVGTLRELFQYAELKDYLSMFVAVSGNSDRALTSGFQCPFGRMLDELNDDPNSFSRHMGKYPVFSCLNC